MSIVCDPRYISTTQRIRGLVKMVHAIRAHHREILIFVKQNGGEKRKEGNERIVATLQTRKPVCGPSQMEHYYRVMGGISESATETNLFLQKFSSFPPMLVHMLESLHAIVVRDATSNHQNKETKNTHVRIDAKRMEPLHTTLNQQ